jgi:hypothetical protein
MKKTVFAYLFFVFITKNFAQENLVLNPSFESYTACPGTSSDLYRAVGWDNAKNSPDYFNVCATNSAFKTPLNNFGYQIPANGNAYAGLFTYDASTTNYRELIIGTLKYPLTVNQKYFVSFKANRADSNYFYRYNTNNLGVRFTKTKYNLGLPNLSNVLMDNFAHFNSINVISDTLNWVKIKGSFIADSAYKYVILGNFFDFINTNVIDNAVGLGNGAYYYIDEVCVTTDSLYNEGYITTSVNSQKPKNVVNISPNPFNEVLNIEFENDGIAQIYSIEGVLMFSESLSNIRKKQVNTSIWPSGMYILKINHIYYKLIIKN